jgi:hypothetical protein
VQYRATGAIAPGDRQIHKSGLAGTVLHNPIVPDLPKIIADAEPRGHRHPGPLFKQQLLGRHRLGDGDRLERQHTVHEGTTQLNDTVMVRGCSSGCWGLRSFRLLDSVLVLQTVKGDRCDWVLRTFDVDKPQGPVQKREDGLF